MKSDCILWIFATVFTLVTVVRTEEREETVQNHPIYKYGYVVAHKNGGSQAHVETRNGNMTLGRYYVNFPNGSGQKVTYLADDVGFHTGVVYSSQTKKGSTKTRIAMGHKALATLENLEGTPVPTIKSKTPPSYGLKDLKEEIQASTNKLEEQSIANYTPNKKYYLLRKPIESSTTASNFIELGPPTRPRGPEAYSNEQQIVNSKKTTFSTAQNQEINANRQEGQSSKHNLNGILTATPPSVAADAAVRPATNQTTTFTDHKSIEKTVLLDFDAQLISKIQKHADEIIMKDLRKSAPSRYSNVQNQRGVYSVTPKLTVTMQPIVVTASDEREKMAFSSDNAKSSKSSQSETTNSFRTVKKVNGSDVDQISKTSGLYEVAVNFTKPTSKFTDYKVLNLNSVVPESRFCESNLCAAADNNQAYSNGVVSIKPLSNNLLSRTDTSNEHKLAPNFYPKNQLKHEMHFVTTIDVQKGISLEVQQNEDGSIRLANNFQFNKLPNYQRPYVSSTVAPILSNSITPTNFPTTHNVQVSPEKNYFGTPVTVIPSDIISNKLLNHHGSSHLKEDHPGKIELVYRIPQPVSSGITHITRDEVENAVKPVPNQNVPQALQNVQEQTSAFYDGTQQRLNLEKETRKQNFVEEERKEYLKNLEKVEQITKQNSPPPRPEIDISSNGLVEDVTANPLLQIETNSVKPAVLNVQEGQVEYDSDVQTPHYENDVNNYALKVPVNYPTVQQIQTPVVYQKPVFSYASEYQEYPGSQESEETNTYYEPQQVPNVLVHNNPQQSSENSGSSTISYAFSQPVEAEDKVEGVQQLTLPQTRLNQIPLAVEQGFLHQPKEPEFEKTILLNPMMAVDYGKAFKVEEPVSLLGTYPAHLEPQSETVPVPSIYPVPQEYQLSVPIHVSPAVNLPEPFSPPSFSVPANPGEYHVTMSYKPHTNKLRIQPLKPSPPQDDESRMEAIRNLLSQPQFNPTYFYAGFPTENRLHLRHINRKKQPSFDQVAAQSLSRREKSLKNLKIEYGFKPPLRPSVEFSEEVKPSIYGPSVPLR